MSQQEDADKPEDQAEDDSSKEEARVPVVISLYEFHPKEDEDDTVTDGGHGLQTVLDRGVALLAEVLEGVPLHCDAVCDDADDAGPVEQLGREEGEVGGGEDDERLDYSDVSGEPRDDTGEQTIDQSNTSTS